MAVNSLTPTSREVGENLEKFRKELDAKLVKVKGKDSTAAMKAIKLAQDLLDDYDSMGVELSVIDGNGKVFDLKEFSILGECGVAWQWKARA